MHHRARRALRDGVGDECMAIAGLAAQRDEQIVRLQRAGVDRDAIGGERRRHRAAGGLQQVVRGPERVMRPIHRCGSMRAPDATSRANHADSRRTACTVPPIVWPCSCPLPATASTSPGPSPFNAAAIALSRSPISRAPGHAASTAARIVAGSSLRGLSSVTIATSANRAAAAPISGRLPRSRSPPAPNTTCSRPARVRTQRRQQPLQRVRRMRVVDIHRRAVRQPRRQFHPPAHAAAASPAAPARPRSPERHRQRRRHQRVVRLEPARQRQLDSRVAPRQLRRAAPDHPAAAPRASRRIAEPALAHRAQHQPPPRGDLAQRRQRRRDPCRCSRRPARRRAAVRRTAAAWPRDRPPSTP